MNFVLCEVKRVNSGMECSVKWNLLYKIADLADFCLGTNAFMNLQTGMNKVEVWESERMHPKKNWEDKEKLGLVGGWAVLPLGHGRDYQVLISVKALKIRKLGLSTGCCSLQVLWKRKWLSIRKEGSSLGGLGGSGALKVRRWEAGQCIEVVKGKQLFYFYL